MLVDVDTIESLLLIVLIEMIKHIGVHENLQVLESDVEKVDDMQQVMKTVLFQEYATVILRYLHGVGETGEDADYAVDSWEKFLR